MKIICLRDWLNWPFLLLRNKLSFVYNLNNPLSASPIKWSNTLKQFVDKLSTNCFSVFNHFVGLTLKGVSIITVVFIYLIFEEVRCPLPLTVLCMTSQNGQTHFKNCSAFIARSSKCVWLFWDVMHLRSCIVKWFLNF